MRNFIEIVSNNEQKIAPKKLNENLLQSFEKKPVNEGAAKRTTPEIFVKMIRDAGLGNKVFNRAELIQFAKDNDTQVPMDVVHNDDFKITKSTWKFGTAGSGGIHYNDDKPKLGAALGGDIDDTTAGIADDSDYNNSVKLAHAKAKEFGNLVSKGKVYVMGRKPKSGAFFRIPGMDELSAQLERMLAQQLEVNGDSTMEEQYEDLEEKVKLVAGGKSEFIKSLLITGAPSQGKSFRIMKAVHDLGLVAGRDYIIKKGSCTVPAMYRILLQQLNGLAIFDDCDSVAKDDAGINILKGALDTYKIREISMDNKFMINVDGFSPEKRMEYATRLSAILNGGEFSDEDDAFFRPIAERYIKISAKKKKKKETKPRDEEDDEFEEIDSFSEDEEDEKQQIIQFILKRLPNKFDFQGRIVFISNMDEDDWDSAITSRAFKIQLNFKSSEMLDYIDRIKDTIETPNVTDEEKEEVLAYVRELYNLGKIKGAINFRLIQQAFDMRLTPNWKRMMATSL